MKNLKNNYVFLKEQGRADEVEVTPAFWSELAEGKFGDKAGERLVMIGEESQDWQSYEMHPARC